jgi:L-threonylcarbamoyladenylate synthase
MHEMTRRTRRLPASQEAVETAAAILRAGGLVAFATETVYGLGADAGNARAVAALYAAKGRPAFNPLIAHVPDLAAAERLGRFDETARRLAAAFWPGPLTLVVPALADCPVCDLARAGLDTVAIRVPAHPLARALLAAFGGAVVAPSANRSGHVSPTEAAHVLADLDGRIDAVLDGGRTPVGVESTILACLPGAAPRLLRPGGVAREMVEHVTFSHAVERMIASPSAPSGSNPVAPGMLASHYAPRAQLRLNAEEVRAGEVFLGFGPTAPPGIDHATIRENLSPAGDPVEAAANLFAMLRALDAAGCETIAVAPIPAAGLGEAINDRLRRAAAPR